MKRLEMPAPVDDGPDPFIEWWDEAFLPKEKRLELNQVSQVTKHGMFISASTD